MYPPWTLTPTSHLQLRENSVSSIKIMPLQPIPTKHTSRSLFLPLYNTSNHWTFTQISVAETWRSWSPKSIRQDSEGGGKNSHEESDQQSGEDTSAAPNSPTCHEDPGKISVKW